jgi:hypothetical protein
VASAPRLRYVVRMAQDRPATDVTLLATLRERVRAAAGRLETLRGHL